MKKIIFLFTGLCWVIQIDAQVKHKLYLIAGHGSDIRVYSKIKFPETVDTVHLHWKQPLPEENMQDFSIRMAEGIDTSEIFSIMGLSLGGMVACEMAAFLDAQQVIIISSAAGREELPLRYRMMKNFQVYRIFSPHFYKSMTKIAQLVYEPDRRSEEVIFDAMIKDKDPDFIKRGIHMVVNWEGNFAEDVRITHIHGTKDHTIPIRNACSEVIVHGGSHMMLLTEPEKLSAILKAVLLN